MRTPDFERRVTETLEQYGLLLVTISKTLSNQQAQMQTTNKRLERIVQLLTPEEAEKPSGPSLAEALLELAAKIDRQSPGRRRSRPGTSRGGSKRPPCWTCTWSACTPRAA